MKTLLLIILLLIPSLCWGGPSARRFIAVNSFCDEACQDARAAAARELARTTINGYTSIQNGATDTGTESKNMANGNITAYAECDAGVASTAHVELYVDAIIRDSIACSNGSTSKTLTYTVAAGTHTVRLYGYYQSGSFIANSFSIPIP
jgi:hypothetical protein